jgi:hypothetical protein
MTTEQNIAETFFDRLPGLSAPTTISNPHESDAALATPHLVLAPQGQNLHDLTAKYREAQEYLAPLRRKGTAQLHDLDSLVAWANRHKGPSSVLYADDGKSPSLTCIADYNGAGAPATDPFGRDPSASHGRHRGHYAFPLSREWTVWTKVSGEALTPGEFGEFIEANAKDLLDPTPALLRHMHTEYIEPWEQRMIDIAQQLQGRFGQYATLVQLSREFTVNERADLNVTLDRDSGASSIQFLNEHQAPDGSPIRIPNLFLIAVPVFDHGDLWRVPVRFRYRKAGAGVKFIMSLHQPEVVFREAVDEALSAAASATGLPLFRGKPEA